MKPLASLKEDLQGILARKEYQAYYRDHQNLLQDFFRRLKDWIYSILKSIFPQADVARASESLAIGISALGVLLLVLLLILLVSRFVLNGRDKPNRMRKSQRPLPTVQHHLSEARTQAEQGEYGPALRYLFLAFILYLNQNHWIEAKAWKTNWEYFAELNEHAPHLADSFTSLAVKFEEATYGGKPISRDDYALYYDEVSRYMREGEMI